MRPWKVIFLTLLLCPHSHLAFGAVRFLGIWDQAEATQLQDFTRQLPASFLQQAGVLQVKIVSTPLPKDPREYGGVWVKEVYEIPLYSLKELKEKKRQLASLSLKKRQAWQILFNQHLLASPQGPPSEFQAYLQRELARGLALSALKKNAKQLQPLWLSLTPWKKHWLGWEPRNLGLKAFAEPRGMLNPKEDLAATLASYLAPPRSLYEDSIRCRMPGKYEFAARLFPDFVSPLNHPSFKNRGIFCQHELWGLLGGITMKDIYSGQTIKIGPLNQQSLIGFELLYATPGDREVSEIAGHLLLRIKLDNNRAAQVAGLENPYDLVVSFLADSSNFEVPPSPFPVEQTKTCKQEKKTLTCK